MISIKAREIYVGVSVTKDELEDSLDEAAEIIRSLLPHLKDVSVEIVSDAVKWLTRFDQRTDTR